MGTSRQWDLVNPDLRDSGPLATLKVDFDSRTGSLRYLRQQVPLTGFTQTGPGAYRANYDLGRFRGALTLQVKGDGSCDVGFTGTWTGKLRGQAVLEASEPIKINPFWAGRSFIGHLATPSSTRGEMACGTLHLWSGAEGKAEAIAAIKDRPPGWMMGDIGGDPTPGHARAKLLFASAKERAVESARLRGVTLVPGQELAQEEFEAIWGRASGDLVYRATLSGMPVQAHGRAGPLSIQSRYELPALRRGGLVSGGFMVGSGIYTTVSIAGDGERPVLGVGKALTGTAETTGGIMYVSGALAEVPEAMALGSGLARVGGGAGTVFVNSYCLVEDVRAGRTEDAVFDGVGVTSGALLLAAPFTGPAAPIVAAVAFALMASQITWQVSERFDGPGSGAGGGNRWSAPDELPAWWNARPEDFLNLRGMTFLDPGRRRRTADEDFNPFLPGRPR